MRAMERPPATARHIAIAQLAGAVLVAVIGMIGGVLMQVELAAPGPKWSAQFYTRLLTFHGLTPLAIGAASLAGGLGYLAICRLVGARRIPAPALAWVAFAVWVIGIACWVGAAIFVTTDTGWELYTPYSLASSGKPLLLYAGPLAIAASATLYAIHLALVVLAHRGPTLQVAIAAVLVIALGAAGVAGMVAALEVLQPQYPNTFTLVFALGLASLAVSGDRKASRVVTLIAIAVSLVWAIHPHVVLAFVIAGLWIALAIMGGFSRPAVAFVVFGCSPAIALHGLASGFLTGSTELYLFDTHFAVGTYHLQMALVGFAALAGLHAWSVRRPHSIVAWIGAVVGSAGLFLHVYSSLVVGGAGMPRRYWDYDPMYTSGHMVSLWGIGVLLAGAVLIAIAWFAASDGRSVVTVKATGSR